MKVLSKDDPTRQRPDLALARKMLNLHPTTSLKEWVFKTIDYFRDSVKTVKEVS